MKTLREHSRTGWTAPDGATIEQINAGSLQRIADATEKMAASYDALREDRDRYQRFYKDGVLAIERRDLQISALKGVITKMRKKATR